MARDRRAEITSFLVHSSIAVTALGAALTLLLKSPEPVVGMAALAGTFILVGVCVAADRRPLRRFMLGVACGGIALWALTGDPNPWTQIAFMSAVAAWPLRERAGG